MSTSTKVPVIILNGFLGSGKTTLFRNLLAQSRKNNIPVKAIVNDMSELDVDGELLATTESVEEDSSILESIYSCVISSKKGLEKLEESINRLLEKNAPELIIIETSGSTHPMPLIEYFKEKSEVVLTGVFALIDSLMLSHDYDYGNLLIPKMQESLSQGKREPVNLLVEQIMFCSHIFLTKSDRVDQERLQDIVSNMQAINPYVPVYSVIYGRLEIEPLLELPEYNYYNVAQLSQELKPVLDLEEQEDRPYDLATRVIKDDRPFHPQRLWDVCHEYLDQRIYRSKGFFWLASRDKLSLLWNQAAGSISLELIGYWRSGILEDENNGLTEMEIEGLKELLKSEPGRFGDRHCDLTVIGDKTQVDRFSDALETCFLDDSEIELYRNGQVFEDPWPKNLARVTSE